MSSLWLGYQKDRFGIFQEGLIIIAYFWVFRTSKIIQDAHVYSKSHDCARFFILCFLFFDFSKSGPSQGCAFLFLLVAKEHIATLFVLLALVLDLEQTLIFAELRLFFDFIG